eukprot:g843.t1
MASKSDNESVGKATSTTLREEKVDSGVTFWTHPQVNGTSTEQRVQFLLGKGLTKEEIEEVKRRAQALLGSSTSVPTSSSSTLENVQAPSTWSQTLRSGATVLAAGMGVSQIISPHPVVRGWWNNMFPSSSDSSKNVTKEKEKTKEEEQPEDFWTRSMMERRVRQPGESLEIKGLRTEIERLQRSIERQEAAMKQMEDNLKSMQRRQDEANRSNQISSELASIKTLLVTRQVEHNIRSSPMSVIQSPRTVDTSLGTNRYITGEKSIISTPERRQNDPILDVHTRVLPPSPPLAASPATNTTNTTNALSSTSPTTKATTLNVDVPDEIRQELDELVKVFQKLCAENTQADLDKTKPVLRLYLSNLIKTPDVPRYRRISTTNGSFKNSIAALKEHENFLSALGFQTRGSNWEYRPNSTSEDREKYLPLLKAGQTMIMNAVSSS